MASTLSDRIWSLLLAAGDDWMSHDLWCAVIRRVAASRVDPEWTDVWGSGYYGDEVNEAVNSLVRDWMNEALPFTPLGNYVDYSCYFVDQGLAWWETISFAGDACGFSFDIVCDLQLIASFEPEEITDELVENRYREWRKCFLQRVLAEARQTNPETTED